LKQAAKTTSRKLPRSARTLVAAATYAALLALAIWALPVKFRFAECELTVAVMIVCAATVSGEKVRSLATPTASVIIGLWAIEFVCAVIAPNAPVTSKGFSTSQPLLGWGPAAPGVYHARRLGRDGSLIYDVDYTIDADGLRRTLSAASGPTVAFFGDSFTFGEGMRDEDTLPQAFADIDQHRLRVLNFGFSGYGPQQFLRAVETGLFDRLLTNAKVFVFQTSAWHAERSSCLVNFIIRAPRYTLQDGEPIFMGPCAEGLMRYWNEFLGNSATFQVIVEPLLVSIGSKDIDLYIAEVSAAAKLARAKYGVPTVVLYLPAGDDYLANSATSDADIERRFRQAGLLVLDGALSRINFAPGTLLIIPGDKHPTAVAHHARAQRLHDFLKENLPNLIASSAPH